MIKEILEGIKKGKLIMNPDTGDAQPEKYTKQKFLDQIAYTLGFQDGISEKEAFKVIKEYPKIYARKLKSYLKYGFDDNMQYDMEDIAYELMERKMGTMIFDVIKTIVKNDGGIESADALTKAVVQKYNTFGNDRVASRKFDTWTPTNKKEFVSGIVGVYMDDNNYTKI